MASSEDETPKLDKLERRIFNFSASDCEIREAADGEGLTFTGYAAVFNSLSVNLGGFRERIQPGCFANAIAQGQDVRFLFNHDANYVLGRTRAGTVSLSEDATGLKVEADLPNTTFARDLAESMRRGDIDAMSFGFWTRADDWKETDTETGLPIRELVQADLFDVSVVAYPAYQATSAAVRASTERVSEELAERAARAAAEIAAEEERVASGSTDLPLGERDETWDAGEAEATLEPEDFSKTHFWRDADGDPDEIGSYKLPFAKRTDSGLQAVWAGVHAAAARLDQTDIPEADVDGVKAKIASYYAKAETEYDDDTIQAPWEEENAATPDGEKRATLADVTARLAEIVREGKSLSTKNRDLIGVAVTSIADAVSQLQDFLEATDNALESASDAATTASRPDLAGFLEKREADRAAAIAEEREWGWEDDYAIYLLTSMVSAGSGFMLSEDDDDDREEMVAITQALAAMLTDDVAAALGGISRSITDADGYPDFAGWMRDLRAAYDAAVAEERSWEWDDDYEVYLLTNMISLGSCYMEYADDDDPAVAVMASLVQRLTALLSKEIGEASEANSADPAGESRFGRERLRLRLLERLVI